MRIASRAMPGHRGGGVGSNREPPIACVRIRTDERPRKDQASAAGKAHEGARRLREACPTDESLYAVDVLVHLARSHFEHEQVEMRDRGYPDGFVHGQDHERLLADLAQLRQSIVEEAGSAARLPPHERLAVWMLSHIAGHDWRYANWLRQHGPNPAVSVKPTWGAHDSHL